MTTCPVKKLMSEHVWTYETAFAIQPRQGALLNSGRSPWRGDCLLSRCLDSMSYTLVLSRQAGSCMRGQDRVLSCELQEYKYFLAIGLLLSGVSSQPTIVASALSDSNFPIPFWIAGNSSLRKEHVESRAPEGNITTTADLTSIKALVASRCL
ncbi:hypothetical protein AV530_018637 [Patagioenas fasciata monilis]|uniref:Uncharacterized protein n=1 Tax=Patagioenas fasciata monilis TaxID=372326 RepID=A0A1V4JGK1_PATFA|nr:hypothetical protein AV530_018637 [Patagioenas fasciata monilis]